MARLNRLVRSLAACQPQQALCVSLFLDLDPGRVPTARDLDSHVTSLIDEAKRTIGEVASTIDHDHVQAAREDIEHAADFLTNELDRSGARGLALYLSTPDSIREEVPLPCSVEDAVHIGRGFKLVPLLESLEHGRDMILAAVGRDRGSLWRSSDGNATPLDDLSRDGQGQHDQGGWSQARYARSRDRDAVEHLRVVADAIGNAIEPGSDTLLVVACLEEQRSSFEQLLAPHVREALLGWATIEAHADESALQPEAQRLLDEHLEEERQQLLERWREQAPAGLATASWQDTVATAFDGRIDTVLVDGRTRDGWECPLCGLGSARPETCELDGTPLEKTERGALELVVRGTVRNGGQVRLATRQSLEDTPGVAALLRHAIKD